MIYFHQYSYRNFQVKY